ncbi:hypothetical protein Sjap_012840 [Stephania japonica]|uniref:Uncharacterized protein n=1 Tax=Stephania japonica TaxID=461633 RepID=A0AAP0IWY1_9MAGN
MTKDRLHLCTTGRRRYEQNRQNKVNMQDSSIWQGRSLPCITTLMGHAGVTRTCSTAIDLQGAHKSQDERRADEQLLKEKALLLSPPLLSPLSSLLSLVVG